MTEPASNTPPQPPTGPTPAPRLRRSTIIFTLVVVAVFALFAWPSLKGLYYRTLAPAVPAEPGWHQTLPDAMAAAQQSHKLVLADFSATWCPPCQIMKHESWPDQRVRDYVAAHFEPVVLDVDAPSSQAPATRYNIETIPAVFVLDTQGNVIRKADSFMTAEQLLKFLQAATPAAATVAP